NTGVEGDILMEKEKMTRKLEGSLRNIVPLSFGEEVGNSVSHGVAALLFIFMLPFTAIYMSAGGGTLHAVGGWAFVISILLTFFLSKHHHSMTNNAQLMYIMGLRAHSLLYVAIDGAYTPVGLSVIGGTWGNVELIVQWTEAVLGILYKVLSPKVK